MISAKEARIASAANYVGHLEKIIKEEMEKISESIINATNKGNFDICYSSDISYLKDKKVKIKIEDIEEKIISNLENLSYKVKKEKSVFDGLFALTISWEDDDDDDECK